MAFPQTSAPIVSTFTTATVSFAVDMPATVNARDLLLMFMFMNSGDTINTPTDWSAKGGGGTTPQLRVFAKIAVGDEGGTQVTVTKVGGINRNAQMHVYRITDWDGNLTGVESAVVSTGSASNFDPPELIPSFSQGDTLWFAIASHAINSAPSAYPSSYTDGVSQSGTSNGRISSCRRELNASSENPGNFTNTNILGWTAITTAIKQFDPTPPAITSVTPDSFTDEDTGIVIAGTTFEAAQGTGKVELGDNATYASANKQEQTVTSWADTSIEFTAVLGALTPGTLYVFVTNNTGDVSTGFEVTVAASGGGVIPVPSTPVFSGRRVRLENIYASLGGHQAPPAGRSEYWLLDKIGKLRGLNLISGYKSEETHLMDLYQNLTGSKYTGSRSTELILRAIEEAL